MHDQNILDLIALNPQRLRESQQAHKIRLIKIATALVKNGGLLTARELAAQHAELYPKSKREFEVYIEKLDEAMGL